MPTVTLYTHDKRVNSTSRPSGGGDSYDCNFIAPCGVLSPRIQLTGIGNPSEYNYARIPAFNRYYWVTEWTWDAQGRWTATLAVDALASWKDEIGASTQYVLRSAAAGNGDIVDNMYPTTAAVTTQIIEVPGILTNNMLLGQYVVNILGAGGVRQWSLAIGEYGALGDALYSTDEWVDLQKTEVVAGVDRDGAPVTTEITENESVLKTNFNPVQYITGIRWFPYVGFTGWSGDAGAIQLGWWTLSNAGGIKLSSFIGTKSGTMTIPTHPQQAARGYYLNMPPYSRYTLQFPGFGQIPLDGSYFVKSPTLNWRITMDAISGVGYLFLSSPQTNGQPFMVVSAQLGVDIPVGQLTSQNVSASVGFLGAVGQVAGAVLGGAAATVATGGAALLAGGAVVGAATKGIEAAINSADQMMLPQVSVSGGSGNAAQFGEPARLICNFMPVVANDVANLGIPLCEPRQLSTLPGFQLIKHADINLPATSAEINAVITMLEGGYFYE